MIENNNPEIVGAFNKLASEMSLDERSSLLERLSSQASISKDPLYEESKDVHEEDLAAQFARLPWYRRLFCLIAGLFTSSSSEKVFADGRFARIGKIIDAKAPGYFDYKHNKLLPLFQAALVELKKGSRFFFRALEAGLNSDKGAFFTFLASLEMSELYFRLQNETDPSKIAEKEPDISESELRQRVFKATDAIFETITQSERDVMYSNARSLYCLKALAGFPFDRAILAFLKDPDADGPTCPAKVIQQQLLSLNNILYSFKEPPSMTIIESLFVFMLQGREDKPDIELEMRKLLAKAEESFVAIRAFNKQLPLNLILRCATRNMTLDPTPLPGGEDWFVAFQDNWHERIEKQLDTYIRYEHKKKLLEAFRYFLKGRSLMFLEHAASDHKPNEIQVRGSFCLSFLQTFHTVVFMTSINGLLRSILIDGDFVKREQRTAFTEAYNDLMKLESDVKGLDVELSATGALGKRYSQALSDSSIPTRLRKTQLVSEDASEEAQAIIDRTRSAIDRIIASLNAIKAKDREGNYDALSNMARFIGKNDPSSTELTHKETTFLNSITEVIQKFQKTLQLMDIIDSLEVGA
jgi:hypothetical protein